MRVFSLPALADGASADVLVALDIAAQILTGQLKPGDPLPAPAMIASRTGTSARVVAAAKIHLRRHRLIERTISGRYRVAHTIYDRPAGQVNRLPAIQRPLP
jgi:DNA-binding FadR family transcriptional regulator